MNSSIRAKRAIGAMFVGGFGYIWIMSWAVQAHPWNWALLAGITLLASILMVTAVNVYRTNKSATVDCENSEANKKTNRIFHIINAAQWICVFIIANVLNNLGKSEWIVAAIIVVVGLHFIPLARLFRYFPHYVVGTALIIWATCYPSITPGGATDALGCLGTGVILWCSALFALTKKTAALKDSV